MPQAPERPSLWRSIVERRLLPVLAAYFGLMWALVEFSNFLVARYGLPDRLIDACFLAMWVFLPLVALLGWKIGAPGRATWSRLEATMAGTLGVLALGALLLQGVWQAAGVPPSRASGVPDPLDIVDINQRITALALFPFEISSSDPDDAWLTDGLAELTKYDLDHDARFHATTVSSTGPMGVLAVVRRLGAESIERAPLSIRRQAARAWGARALAVGKASRQASGWRVELELYRLSPDASSGPFVFEASDPWEAIDRIAATIRAELAPPAADSPANDPSIRSVTSDSLLALRRFVEGSTALYAREHQQAADAFAEAASIDPGLVLASYMHAVATAWLGDQPAAIAILERIEPRLGALPPRWRFQIQAFIKQRSGDRAGERRVYAVWSAAMPNDWMPQLQLAELDVAEHPDDDAAWARLRKVALESGASSVLQRLARRLHVRGDLDQALDAARLARARDPSDYQSLILLADIELARGEFDAARAYLDDAAILRADLVHPLLRLAELDAAEGHPDAGMKRLDALENDQRLDAAQRAALLESRIAALIDLGRLRDAEAEVDRLTAMHAAPQFSTIQLTSDAIRYAPLQAMLHGPDAARDWAIALASTSGTKLSPADQAMIDVWIALGLEDGPRLQAAVAALREGRTAVGAPTEDGQTLAYAALGRGFTEPSEQACVDMERALDSVRQDAIRIGSDAFLRHMQHAAVGIALDSGDAARSRRWLQRAATRSPADPDIRYLQARLAVMEGDAAEARRLLDLALATWTDADAEFVPAQRARTLRDSL